MATQLLLAVECGEVPASSTQIATSDGVPHSFTDDDELRTFIDKSANQGTPRIEFLDDLLEERGITLRIDRAGTLLFAQLYSYAPPPWWAPSVPSAGNEGQRRSAGTWQRESCLKAFAALYPTGIPDPAIKTNQKLVAEVKIYLKTLGPLAPSDDTILREAGRKPRRAGN